MNDGFHRTPLAFMKMISELQEDLAVLFYGLAVLQNVLHNSLGIRTFCELNVHLESHEAYHSVLDALGLLCGLFHEVGAVGAVYVDLV